MFLVYVKFVPLKLLNYIIIYSTGPNENKIKNISPN